MSTPSAIHEELRKILTIEHLPAMPHSALTVLQLDNDLSKVNINDLVRPIEADPALAAQVLKFLNSSYFGFQSAISNVKQGVALVGIRIVKNFVLWKAVFSLIPKSMSGAFDVAMLWQDSLRRAMFARFMLLEIKKGDAEMAFAGALLQDMAIPLLLKIKKAEYGAVLDQLAKGKASRLSELEKSTFGWTHADAGGFMGAAWKLPQQLTGIIESHLRIDELLDESEEQAEKIAVALSAFLPIAANDSWLEQELFQKYFSKVFPGKERIIKTMFDRVDREFDQYAQIIQIPKPKRTLSSYIEES
ncbi:MAG: HDOD domain-containing protein [Planctomycetaceae bacterium]|jgi:HD-like signal output (HDOD) protein|nr:HDOD domain-containing protein [Planctomycetaceae bacterium]